MMGFNSQLVTDHFSNHFSALVCVGDCRCVCVCVALTGIFISIGIWIQSD